MITNKKADLMIGFYRDGLDVMGVKTGTVSFFVPFLNGIRLLK